jgi:DNA modification methylase
MTVRILKGDCRDMLRTLPDESVHCVVTSPPYFGLRDYGTAEWKGGDADCSHMTAASGRTQNKGNNGKFGQPFKNVCGHCGAKRVDRQIGLEATPDAFVSELVAVFAELRRVLRKDGTAWLNLGDSYAGSGKGGNPEGSQWAGFVGNKAREKAAQPIGKQLWGMKPKDLIGIPWRVAFALQADGWYLRQDIIWSKPNPMPESVRDRCTKAHEYLFLLSKSERYFYDQDAIAEPIAEASIARLAQDVDGENGSDRVPGKTNGHMKAVGRASGGVYTAQAFKGQPQSEPRGSKSNFGDFTKRNRRSVWEVTTQPFSDAHFATFPPALIEPCILAGCPKGGTVLDPFGGAGTTGLVADRLERNAILIELNPEYAAMAERRIRTDGGMFAQVAAE